MNKISIKIAALFLIVFLSLKISVAQDVHYSQMYNTPLYVNPALTGNHECDFRAGANFRQQAASFTVPFETYTAWGDGRLYPGFLNRRSWIGLGGHFYYDNAGDGELKKIQGMGFFSFSQGFNSDNSLYGSLGVGVGVTNRSIDMTKLIFDNQWDPINLEFNPDLSTGEQLSTNSIFYFDFNLGILVHQLVSDKLQYEVGASISHINRPQESFFGEPNKVGMKYIAHGDVQWLLSPRVLLKPAAYFIFQEDVTETNIGANLVFGATSVKLLAGLWTRVGRDIIPTLGIEYSSLNLMFSYDVNISQQHAASNYRGGFEISLVKRFCYSSRKSTKREPCKFLEF
jgi:type IX secretion system PorP/SprF family membrane protein